MSGYSGYIDAHCHLADPRWEVSPALLARAREAGVERWIQGGVEPADWQRQLELRERFPEAVIPCFGLHPVWVAQNSEETCRAGLEALERELPRAVALGELGLDHGPKIAGREDFEAGKERQLRYFEAQLELGIRHSKPLVLHIVQAHGEALELLKRKRGPEPYRGIVHSFSGSAEVAQEYLALGFALSISGVAARPGYKALKQTLPGIPADRLTLETDAPDQSPEPVTPSGERPLNRPENLIQVAEAVGAVLGQDAARLLDKSRENLMRIFQLTGQSS